MKSLAKQAALLLGMVALPATTSLAQGWSGFGDVNVPVPGFGAGGFTNTPIPGYDNNTSPFGGAGSSTSPTTSTVKPAPNTLGGLLPREWKLNTEGRYSIRVNGKDSEVYRISRTHVFNKGNGADLGPNIVPLPQAAVSTEDLLAKLQTQQAISKRTHWVVLEKEGSVEKTYLSRLVNVVLKRPSEARNLGRGLGALKTVVPSGTANAVYEFAGPVDALRAAEALRAMSDSVVSAEPIVAMNAPVTKFRPNDPFYPPTGTYPDGQWHLPFMNCEAAWDVSKGRLVRIYLIDDGIAFSHQDLRRNVSPGWNYFTDSTDVYQAGIFGNHGTQMGGLISAMTHNRLGVAGVSFESRVTAYALVAFVGESSDAGLYSQLILPTEIGDSVNPGGRANVSSNSWGYVRQYEEYPQEWRNATEDAMRRGNGGRGLPYVVAAGNLADIVPEYQEVGTDAPHSRRVTISVGSINAFQLPALYSEPGAALTCLGPSDDRPAPPPRLLTTAAPNGYTNQSGWTSGAAANVAGVIGLMVRTKFNLNTRDIQEIIHRTTDWIPDPTWIIHNANGYTWHFNYLYGSGSINASAAVSTARRWKNLRPALSRNYSSETEVVIPNPGAATKNFRVPNVPKIRVEHALFTATLLHPRGSELMVRVTSPGGRTSIMVAGNPAIDLGRPPTWDYKTNFSWGECSGGDWRFQVVDLFGNGFGPGILQTVTMEIFGGPAPVATDIPDILNSGSPNFCVNWHPDMPPLASDELPPAYEICHRYEEYGGGPSKINATQCPIRYWAKGLPAGMFVDDVTGQIKGTPAGIDPPPDQPPGTPIFYNVVLYAQNERGTNSKAMRMRVYPWVPDPFPEPSNVATATVGEPFVWRINYREDAPHRYRIGGPTPLLADDGRTPNLPPELRPGQTPLCDGNAYILSGDPVTNTFTADVTHGPANSTDLLPSTNIVQIQSVIIDVGGVLQDATAVVPRPYTVSGGAINWSPPGIEPLPGATYQVNFVETTPGGMVIQGVPQTAGFYHFSIRADNYCGTKTLDFYLNVQPAGRGYAAAANIPGQKFTVDGADSWFNDDLAGVDGSSALVSPIFDQNPGETTRRTADLTTRVQGPATIRFCWRSKTATDDSGKFLIDSNLVASISQVSPPISGGTQGWIKEAFNIPAGLHTVTWRYHNFDSSENASDHVWVDDIVIEYPNLRTSLDITKADIVVSSSGSTTIPLPWLIDPLVNPTLFAAPTLKSAFDPLLGLNVLPNLTEARPATWSVQNRQRVLGANAVQSGPINDSETSSLEIKVPGPARVDFQWKVHTTNSDGNIGDFLSFSIDGVQNAALSGVTGWIRREAVLTESKVYTLRFTYAKDASPAPLEYLWGPDLIPNTGDDQTDNGPDRLPGTPDDLKDKAWVDGFICTPLDLPSAAIAASMSPSNSVGSAAPVSAASFAVAGSGDAAGSEAGFSRTEENGQVVYTYQVDTARAGSARTGQISSDGVTWQTATSVLHRQEGTLQTYQVRGSLNDANYNFFRVVP